MAPQVHTPTVLLHEVLGERHLDKVNTSLDQKGQNDRSRTGTNHPRIRVSALQEDNLSIVRPRESSLKYPLGRQEKQILRGAQYENQSRFLILLQHLSSYTGIQVFSLP